jgi:16S rRNA C967 or C1407 C5-methylase (RsmB/RsmF family)
VPRTKRARKSGSQEGAARFDAHFSEVHGERWTDLKSALVRPPQAVARLNRFANPSNPQPDSAEPIAELPGVVKAPPDWKPMPDAQGLLSHYWMDAGSVVAAQALPLDGAERVLDLCAAPGGKTLILAERMAAENGQGEVVANDRSAARRNRLRRVVDDYLPPDVRESITLTGHDATRWCLHEKHAFDAILLDAPCSSERHLLAAPERLADWKAGRTRRLAQQQYAMLASALDVVRVGGHVLYSTCSISPLENDGPVEKLLKKRAGRVETVNASHPLAEATSHGWLILPDRNGHGPIFYALLKRVA